MKKFLICYAAFLLSVALVGCSFKESCAGFSRWLLGHHENRKEVMARIDTNHDGVVDAEEWAKSALDLNGDGVIQPEELTAGEQDTEGSNLPGTILGILAGLGVPFAGVVKVALDQRKHLRAVIAGIEDVKDQCMSQPAGSGSPLSADNWAEIKAKLTSAAALHTNPAALNALVQKLTGS